MKLIILTHPELLPGETDILNRLFAEGLSCLHLRKPSLGYDETRSFIEAISHQYHSRIVIHDHYQLAHEFALKGVHFNQRNRHLFDSFYSEANSISVHAVEELRTIPTYFKYAFLSPIFDSISKEGYQSAFTHQALDKLKSEGLIHNGIIALGGITENNLSQVDEMGFGGAALLGSFWKNWIANEDADELLATYRRLRNQCRKLNSRRIARLQYISNPRALPVCKLVDSADGMLAAGTPLIQIRNKHLDSWDVITLANSVRPMAQKSCATFIINDDPYKAMHIGADGVHLGKKDMPVRLARQLMGDNYIIGGTANTFQDIKNLHEAGADYIGLGPFRFTTTKDNLSPVLGLEGLADIMNQCVAEGITTPVVAIGGITIDDVDNIMQTGVYGVAMSGGLEVADLDTCKQRIETILKTIQRYER